MERALHQNAPLPSLGARMYPSVLGPDDRCLYVLVSLSLPSFPRGSVGLIRLLADRLLPQAALQYYSPLIFANLGFDSVQTLRYQSYNSIVSRRLGLRLKDELTLNVPLHRSPLLASSPAFFWLTASVAVGLLSSGTLSRARRESCLAPLSASAG
jgi:hypothetical protein